MIPITAFAGKKVAIFGLGNSGLASARALLAGGAHVIAWDDNADVVAKATRAGVPTADLRHVEWSSISALVLAPGVPLTHPAPHWLVGLARAAAVEVIGDIELFCRERRRQAPRSPFVAVTGTNGKSTTTALIAHLMHCAGHDTQVGGDLGTAILSLDPPRAGRVHVIEASSYQIDLSPTLDPAVGVLINVSEDHLRPARDIARLRCREGAAGRWGARGTAPQSSAWTTTGARRRRTASSARVNTSCDLGAPPIA